MHEMIPALVFKSKYHNYDVSHLKVFVHGYLSAADERDKTRLIEHIPELADSEDAVFAFWDSGSVRELLASSLKAGAKGFSVSKLGLAVSTFRTIKTGVGHFNAKKVQSAAVGQAFFVALSEFIQPYTRLQTISLYGHSLGAGVLIDALLCYQGQAGVRINNLVLMGGARELKAAELERLLGHIQGRLYNFYSKNDRVLQLKPSLEKMVGRHALHSTTSPHKLYNAKLSIGHTDYWGMLRTVFNYVKNEGDRQVMPTDMKHPHVLADVLLYPLIYCAEPEDIQLLARIVAVQQRRSAPPEGVEPECIAHAIQLLGGHRLANKARGERGVAYPEIVGAAAQRLGLSGAVGEHTALEREEKIYKAVLRALRSIVPATERPLADTVLLQACFSTGRVAASVDSLYRVLCESSVTPGGPQYSLTIPLVAVVHALRKKQAAAECVGQSRC